MSYLIIQRNKGCSGNTKPSVHLAESRRIRGVRHPKQERKYIGTLDEEGYVKIGKGFRGRSGEKILLKDLERMVKEGKDVLEWLRGGERKYLSCGVEVCGVEEIGVCKLFKYLAKGIGLYECLKRSFGKSIADALVLLGGYQNFKRTALYLAECYLSDLPIEEMVDIDLSSSGISRFTTRLGKDSIGMESFYQAWIKKLSCPEGVLHDTTSISTYGLLEDAEYGYNRDREKLPQVNLSLAMDKKSGLPFYYRILPGSIPDVSTLSTNISILESLGLKKFSYFLDRGFYSKSNISEMLEKNIEFTIGVPLTNSIARNALKKNASKLRSLKTAFRFNGTEMRYTRDIICFETSKGVKKLALFVFRDPKRKAERESELIARALEFEEKVSQLKFESIREAKEYLRENGGILSRCFSVSRQPDGKIAFSLKRKTLASKVATLGHSVVLTTQLDAEPVTVLENYRSRDAIEKIFDILKNEVQWKRIRTNSPFAAQGRIFMAFIAIILRLELEKRVKEAGLSPKYTITEILNHIGKIRRLRMSDGSVINLEITKKQRTILEKLHCYEAILT